MESVTKDIINIGVDDREIDLFEGQYPVPDGIRYNSYIILDEKTAVTDTVSEGHAHEWLGNLREVLGGRKPDYLIIHHMEPDHSASVMSFLREYPDSAVVANAKAFTMAENFFGKDFCKNRVIIANGDTLSLGKHELQFIFAPMVHWPEVTVTYDRTDKVLFSADAFGTFGASGSNAAWDGEARRYYIGIVGKYGAQVQNLLKAVGGLDIEVICSLHGPVIRENAGHCIEKYNIWSSYSPEADGVVIAYASVYGNTKKAAILLAGELEKRGACVKLYDLARSDMSEAVADSFRYSKTVLAATTYNAEVFPAMRQFIEHLTERNFQKRTVGFIENGSWAPMAAKIMKGMLEKSKDLKYIDTAVTVKSTVSEQNREDIGKMADELCGGV